MILPSVIDYGDERQGRKMTVIRKNDYGEIKSIRMKADAEF